MWVNVCACVGSVSLRQFFSFNFSGADGFFSLIKLFFYSGILSFYVGGKAHSHFFFWLGVLK